MNKNILNNPAGWIGSIGSLLSQMIVWIYVMMFLVVFYKHFVTIDVDAILYWSFLIAVILVVTGPIGAVFWTKLFEARRRRSTFIFPANGSLIWLMLLGLLVKLSWVLTHPVAPYADYLTFHRTAEMLSRDWVIHFPYVALFPHIMGYASFLSLFYVLFGAEQWVAPLVNVMLSLISLYALYTLTHRLFGTKSADVAALLWIFLPSETMYNTLVLSEPLYTALIFIWLNLFLYGFERLYGMKHLYGIERLNGTDRSGARHMHRVLGRGSSLLYAIWLGLLLGVIQAVRPVGTILLLSAMIWLVIVWARYVYMLRGHQRHPMKELPMRKLSMKELSMKELPMKDIPVNKLSRKGWEALVFAVTLTVVFFLSGKLVHVYNDARLGEMSARSVGYSLYVGMNEKSMGKWNRADSDLLFEIVMQHPEWSAEDVQQEMMQKTWVRMQQRETSWLQFFLNKLHVLWGSDAMGYYYSKVKEHVILYPALSNGYFYMVIVYSMIGLVAALRLDHAQVAVLIALYVLGLSAAHMLVEVAVRYHYSALALMIPLAAKGIGETGKRLLSVFASKER